jgi:hypothetical protein
MITSYYKYENILIINNSKFEYWEIYNYALRFAVSVNDQIHFDVLNTSTIHRIIKPRFIKITKLAANNYHACNIS